MMTDYPTNLFELSTGFIDHRIIKEFYVYTVCIERGRWSDIEYDVIHDLHIVEFNSFTALIKLTNRDKVEPIIIVPRQYWNLIRPFNNLKEKCERFYTFDDLKESIYTKCFVSVDSIDKIFRSILTAQKITEEQHNQLEKYINTIEDFCRMFMPKFESINDSLMSDEEYSEKVYKEFSSPRYDSNEQNEQRYKYNYKYGKVGEMYIMNSMASLFHQMHSIEESIKFLYEKKKSDEYIKELCENKLMVTIESELNVCRERLRELKKKNIYISPKVFDGLYEKYLMSDYQEEDARLYADYRESNQGQEYFAPNDDCYLPLVDDGQYS
jgi:hypothetical protein